MSGFLSFELDLMRAVMDQLVPKLDALRSEPLIPASVANLPDAQGVYQLLYGGRVMYIGKTDADAGLRTRLTRHLKKFMHRQGIAPGDVTFKAAHIQVLTAMDIETELIRHYKERLGAVPWNGSGFGSNDPGRQREETNKPIEGFDAQFPINIDIPANFVPPGTYRVADFLWQLKEILPYTLRYQTEEGGGSQAYRTRPHPDYLASQIMVPLTPSTVRWLMQTVVAALPAGWQATEFVSHVILYKENRAYTHGRRI